MILHVVAISVKLSFFTQCVNFKVALLLFPFFSDDLPKREGLTTSGEALAKRSAPESTCKPSSVPCLWPRISFSRLLRSWTKSAAKTRRRSSLWDASYLASLAPYLGQRDEQPPARKRLSLLGLAPDGVCRASPVTRAAGGLLHHRFTLTGLPPRPFDRGVSAGDLLSVALCRRVAPPGYYPASCSVELGLSSRRDRGERPSSQLRYLMRF